MNETSQAFAFDLSVPAPPTSPALQTHSSGNRNSAARTGITGLIITAGLFLFKFKAALGLLKFSKIFTTAGSMLVSIGVYSVVWGWKFATGIVLLTFVHEMGHVYAAWIKKLPVSAPMFIPFMGAFITLKKHPQDALTEAHIGYGGPALGAVGDTVAWGLYYVTGNALFLAVASVSMMINLFNLMPVSPLDGGRIVTAISPRVWLVGLIGMAAWFFVTFSPIMLLVLIVGGLRLAGEWKVMGTSDYYKVSARDRLRMTLLYLGLAFYLALGHTYTHHLVTDSIRMPVTVAKGF